MNTPILRFPGFSQVWKTFEINQVTDYVDYRGKTPNKVDSGIPLITAKNIKNGYIDYEISKEYVNPTDYQKIMSRGLPKIGDVLLTTEAPLGNVAQINDENIALAQRVIKFRAKSDFLLNDFLKLVFLSQSFRTLLYSKAIGTTVLGIQGKVLHKLPVSIPNVKEQQKIAEFFNLLDHRIEKQQEKVETLRELKKGLLQKILNRELRFKGQNGEEFPEWKMIKLSKALKIQNGFPFKSEYFNENKEGMPLIRIRDLTSDSLETYYSGKFDESFIVNNNDVLIGMDGEFNTCKWLKGPALLNQRVMKIIALPGYDLNFLYQILTLVVKEIEYKTPQTTVKHLSNKDINNYTIEIPCYNEQLKIGNFFDSLDKSISLETDLLNNLIEQRRGFLQQMFI